MNKITFFNVIITSHCFHLQSKYRLKFSDKKSVPSQSKWQRKRCKPLEYPFDGTTGSKFNISNEFTVNKRDKEHGKNLYTSFVLDIYLQNPYKSINTAVLQACYREKKWMRLLFVVKNTRQLYERTTTHRGFSRQSSSWRFASSTPID